MKTMLRVSLFSFLLLTGSLSFSQHIKPSSLSGLYGYWKGALTYLDYGTGKPFTMPAELAIYPIKNALVIQTTYPEEPQANNNDTVFIADEDTMFMGSKIISFTKDSSGNFEIITQTNGIDGNDNKPALLRKKYSVQKDIYKVQKNIQFTGTDNWIVRHTYKFRRQNNSNTGAFAGSWIIDLRPGIASAPYTKKFTVQVKGKEINGTFYDTPFTGGLINTEWNKISFAFTTKDNSGEYVHTGFFQDGKLTGFTYSKSRGMIMPWFSIKKE